MYTAYLNSPNLTSVYSHTCTFDRCVNVYGRQCNVQSIYNITHYVIITEDFNIKFYSLTEMRMHVQSCSQINFMVGYVEHNPCPCTYTCR